MLARDRTLLNPEYSLDYHGLCRKIQSAKQGIGFRRAQSKLSLIGETRTFAEILDGEVEKVVLFYIKEQGSIAGRVWELRSYQISSLQDHTVSIQKIDDMFQRYRSLGGDVLNLLGYLDENVKNLRKIIKRHDSCFDVKLGTMYFDLSIGKNSKNAQLLPMYHQDGIRAIMSTIRKGFEDLYDAKNAIKGGGEDLFISQGSVLTGRTKAIPRISFGKRLASAGNLKSLMQPSAAAPATASNPRYKSTGSLFTMMRTLSDPPEMQPVLERSLSDLEPILKNIDCVAERVLLTQQQTVAEVLTANSEMALEVSVDDMPSTPGSEEEPAPADPERFSAHVVGLYINLFITFVYLANQYVVAPTSAEYARLLGMTPAMGGVIIGLCPAAAMVSSLLYSKWSNHSFTHPILVCIVCGIVGNIAYGMALQCNSSMLIILGRLITGFGGPRVISRRYIADHVPAERRLVASSQFVTAGAMGLACGPLISSLVERSGLVLRWRAPSVFTAHVQVEVLWYQAETAPGWIMAVLWVIALVLVLTYFHEPARQYMRATKLKRNSESMYAMELAVPASPRVSVSRQVPASPRVSGSRPPRTPKPPSHHSNNDTSTYNLTLLPPREALEAGHGARSSIRTSSSYNQLLRNTEMNGANACALGHASPHQAPSPSRAPSPINLTSANNNVFNLTKDRIEDAIPFQLSEETGLLSEHSSGMFQYLAVEQPYPVPLRDGHRGFPGFAALESPDDYDQVRPKWWQLITAEVVVILLLYMVNKIGQELVISSIPVITREGFGWTQEGGGYYMAAVGASVLPMILLVNSFVKDLEERELVLRLSNACVLCLLVMLHASFLGSYTLFQYIAGSAVLFAFLNALEGVIMALLAKVISPELARGTFNSGLLATEAGTFGRVLGDFCITLFGVSHNAGDIVNGLFLPLVVMILASSVLVWVYYDRFV